MKNLRNLKGAKALNKKEQLNINGGLGNHPCGKTGGMILPNVLTPSHCSAAGGIWYNGDCWVCY